MMKLVIVVALATLCLQCQAKKHFERCELVRELRRQGFPEDKMANWICLIENESGRWTDKTNDNKNGSRDYGLFQINDQYWCTRNGSPGKDCNVKCSDLMTNDITAAAKCAKKIFKRHGFNAWYGWKNHCQTPGALPNISSC